MPRTRQRWSRYKRHGIAEQCDLFQPSSLIMTLGIWALVIVFACGTQSRVLEPSSPTHQHLTTTRDLTLSVDNASLAALGAVNYECNADPYGRPALASCLNAFNHIPNDQGTYVFFQRGQPLEPEGSMAVPYRISSCKMRRRL